MALGPVVGPLGRVARGGRNWECYSPDRRSSTIKAEAFVSYYVQHISQGPRRRVVEGIQNSAIVSICHFISNEQERR
jgi:beta-glucosidase